MHVVSVINYKGGVGKTTLTANLGAALAFKGRKVLLIDLDPQTSLTFSFYGAEVWEKNLADSRTIKQWYDTTDERAKAVRLIDLVTTPPRVNAVSGSQGGRLDIVASHLELINIDLELAAELGGGTWMKSQANYLKTHRRLADGLNDGALAEYDYVLIDCAPNFNITTKTAIVASSHLLIPARPDYLSTLGISYLVNRTKDLVSDYNACVESKHGQKLQAKPIGVPAHSVVFTMVQHYAGEPILALRPHIEQVQRLGVPTFHQMIRDNKTLFASAGESGIPAVLSDAGNAEVVEELDRLTEEFTHWIESD